jgi:hypothetical protein
MKKGVVAVLLYIVVIILSILIGSEGILIVGLFLTLLAGIILIVGFIMANLEVKNKPRIHFLVNPSSNEHIVMPIFFLFSLYIGNIIWLFSPEIGAFIMSLNSLYAVVALPPCSIALGGIISYFRFHASTVETTSE